MKQFVVLIPKLYLMTFLPRSTLCSIVLKNIIFHWLVSRNLGLDVFEIVITIMRLTTVVASSS